MFLHCAAYSISSFHEVNFYEVREMRESPLITKTAPLKTDLIINLFLFTPFKSQSYSKKSSLIRYLHISLRMNFSTQTRRLQAISVCIDIST